MINLQSQKDNNDDEERTRFKKSFRIRMKDESGRERKRREGKKGSEMNKMMKEKV